MLESSEYHGRLARLCASMKSEGLDAVLLTADANIEYFSGFRHHAPWTLFARPFFAIISADRRAVFLAHTFLEPEVRRTAAIEDVRSFTQSGRAPIDQLVDVIAELGVAHGRIGMELGSEQRLGISVADFKELESRPGMRLTDCAELLWRLRRIKSAAEIELLTRSAEITTDAFQACFSTARPGMTEIELARFAAERMVQLGAEPGFILMASGSGNYGHLSGKPTSRKVQHDEMLWIDMGAVYQSYWSDFCRAAYFGKRSGDLDRGQEIIKNVNRAAIEAARIGNTMRDIADASLAMFRKHGIDASLGQGRIGHGIGLMSTEPPHVALYDDTPCEEGLAFTIEPRFVTDRAVFNCEELVVVTRSGPRVLTTASREIHYIS